MSATESNTADVTAATPEAPRGDVLHYVGGALRAAASRRWLDNVEPATGASSGRIARGGPDDVAAAVASADAAADAWVALGPDGRAAWMERIADAIEARLDDFARAEAIDNGKPVDLARAVDIPRAVSNFRFFAGAIRHGRDEAYLDGMAGLSGPGSLAADPAINYVLRRPVRIAGCISPWNLPLYLFTWKIAPALAVGATVVAKPSEVTPLTAHLLGHVCHEVGLPAGVLNIVHGLGPEVGAAIVEHPDIAAISFTGGTATGRAIAATAAPMFKKLSLELGGKNPTIVFADAVRSSDDFTRVVDATVRAAFANQGQICLCGSRILVERSVADEFTAAVVERTRELACGDPLVAGTRQGAMVSRDHRDKVESYLTLAAEEGGVIACGGVRPVDLPERVRGGFYLEPAVITGLDAGCRTNTEEIFGPVAAILPFEDEAEAVAIANRVDYGLAASIWTSDLDRAHRVAARVQAGVIWVNCWLRRDLRTPFGGMKHSGVGREGGEEALRFFTEPSNVCVQVGRGE
ncbi:MAG: aldehyde dehydrogenase [Phycisphaerales bacterium]